jgi:acyl carrier protein
MGHMTDTARRVCKTIARLLDLEPAEVLPTMSFSNDLGVDSLQMMELIMAFEEEFLIDIDDKQADKILTVGDAVRYIKGVLGEDTTEGP